MQTVDVYESAFGTVKLTGLTGYIIPLHQPDYFKERALYNAWKSKEASQRELMEAIDKLYEVIWKQGGNLREIVVS